MTRTNSDIKSSLRKAADWANSKVEEIDIGGPKYGLSAPYLSAFLVMREAEDRIAYLEGKIDGLRLAFRDSEQ